MSQHTAVPLSALEQFADAGLISDPENAPAHLKLFAEQADRLLEKVHGMVDAGRMTPEKAHEFRGLVVDAGAAVLCHPIVAGNRYLERFSQGVTLAQARHEIQQFSVFGLQFDVAQAKLVANARTPEAYMERLQVLLNEKGIPYTQGFEGELSGRWSPDTVHFSWMQDTARGLGLSFEDLGKIWIAHPGTRKFVEETFDTYASTDQNLAMGASFAVENWAANALWTPWIAGMEKLNATLEKPIDLGYLVFHEAQEAHHSQATLDELLETFLEPWFDRVRFMEGAEQILTHGVQAYYESQLAHIPDKDGTWPTAACEPRAVHRMPADMTHAAVSQNLGPRQTPRVASSEAAQAAAMDKDETPSINPLPLKAVHHVELLVGNAKQAAYYYRHAFGFSQIAYAGPETGVRDQASYVLQQGDVRLVVSTPLFPDDEMAEHLRKHGDGVLDVAFLVDDVDACFQQAVARGARSAREPYHVSHKGGLIRRAKIRAYGDTLHSFISLADYAGPFLPGYEPSRKPAAGVGLMSIDHIVGNVEKGRMNDWGTFYNRVLGFHQFMSFDDKDISTEFSSLRSQVMADASDHIKFPINEPAPGRRKSQIQEFLDYNAGPGVQHIALLTDDLIHTVTLLRANGVEFLDVPDSYYDRLFDRVHVTEDHEALRRLRILADQDDKGYLLQIFTKPVEDRPTLFFEIIQREGCNGFGKGNFRALFGAIEQEQARRGNLTEGA
jgi:4-hydroxyphenylpyruvate dioxygenase